MIKQKMIKAHLRAAEAYGMTSYAVRLQVGAVIVNQLTDQPVSAGWNGMPPGEPNICEEEVDGVLVSKPNVVHAEINALSKIPAKNPRDFLTLFCTDSPCPACAKEIYASGIRQVIFTRRYRLDEGLMLLLKGGLEVFHQKPEGLYSLVLSNGNIIEHPAPFTDDNILMCKNFVSGQKVKPYGLSKHHKGWTHPEKQRVFDMFQDGATVEEIAESTDRSFSSICSLLCRESWVSWAASVGYMVTETRGKRAVWCGAQKIAHNKRALIEAVASLKPEVIMSWDVHQNIDLLVAEFPHVSPLLLKKMCKVNNQ